MPTDPSYNLNGRFKPTTKRSADLDGVDFYPTPAWATYALIENEWFEGDIWECACGDGSMTEVLARTGMRVVSSDLYDRGFGEPDHDFLTSNRRAANIITNPPFHSAEGFVAQCLKLAEAKFALRLRLAFLEGGEPDSNNLPQTSACARVGLQRADHLLSQGGQNRRQRHHGVRMVHLGQGPQRTNGAEVVQAGLQGEISRLCDISAASDGGG